ncbi:MAG TPA: hypothetical protein VIF83_14135 [Gemmatimonadaceae bacterium]|jgi:hypothetical protein
MSEQRPVRIEQLQRFLKENPPEMRQRVEIANRIERGKIRWMP